MASHGDPIRTQNDTFLRSWQAGHVLCGHHTCAVWTPYMCCVDTTHVLCGHHTCAVWTPHLCCVDTTHLLCVHYISFILFIYKAFILSIYKAFILFIAGSATLLGQAGWLPGPGCCLAGWRLLAGLLAAWPWLGGQGASGGGDPRWRPDDNLKRSREL